MYNAYITEVKELRKHSNADRLQVATFFGNDTIVGLDVKVGDKVITSKYSGTEIKLDGEEYIIVRQGDILAIVE